MINNKKIALIYIVCFFLFLTLILFPNYNAKTKLFTFSVKEKLQTPLIFVRNEVSNIFAVLNLNKNYINDIKKFKNEIDYLRSINKYLLILTSKYSEQNKIFQNSNIEVPISVK